MCSLLLGCLPCLHTDALELLLKDLVWVVELGGKPFSVEPVPWSSIANLVLLNQGFKEISWYSERLFLSRPQWKIIWIDPDPLPTTVNMSSMVQQMRVVLVALCPLACLKGKLLTESDIITPECLASQVSALGHGGGGKMTSWGPSRLFPYNSMIRTVDYRYSNEFWAEHKMKVIYIAKILREHYSLACNFY